MKKNSLTLAGAALCSLFITSLPVFAQGTAFTYQGRLNDAANPANGTYDFRFRLASDPLANNYVGGNVFTNGLPVGGGLFTVALEFGGGIFTGTNLWLEVGVRTNGAASYSVLTPLQAVTPAPYAIFAANLGGAGLGGTYGSAVTFNNAANQFSGTYTGNGANLNNVNALTLGGVSSSNFWRLGGNDVSAGQFLGSTNNQPLELRVNGARALRLEVTTSDLSHSNIVNVVGGSSANFVAPGVFGGTIAGGGAKNFLGIAGSNTVAGNFGTVGGGYLNIGSGTGSVVSGGFDNKSTGNYSTVGGGAFNTASGTGAFVGGGGIDGSLGYPNTASGVASVISGGLGNVVNAHGGTIAGGVSGVIQTNANQSSIGGGTGHLIEFAASRATIGGGYFNTILTNAYNSTISGGDDNTIEPFAVSSLIGGGSYNRIQANAQHSVLDGGEFNLIQTNSLYSTVGGGHLNTILPGATDSTIGGGLGNTEGGIVVNTTISGATVAGGVSNRADCAYSFIGGGKNNTVNDFLYTFITTTLTTSPYAVIAGGELNSVGTSGGAPTYPADHSAIGGGYANAVRSASQSVISGGGNNVIYSGNWSAIPGGQNNEADGYWSLAAGQRAKAYHSGAFVWADSTAADFASTADNQFCVRANGGIRVSDDTPSIDFGSSLRQMLQLWGGLYGVGVQASTLYFRTGSGPDDGFAWYRGGVHSDSQFDAGSGGTQLMRLDRFGLTVNGTFVSASDRNLKENFKNVDPQEVLAKVAALPLNRWNYKEDRSSEHLGPMAQDFYAAFHVGPDDKHIAVVDEGGVALAAIQGLNEKVEVRSQKSEVRSRMLEERLQQKETEITELKQRFEALEGMVQKIKLETAPL